MRLWPPRGIKYGPRHGIVLCRHNIINLDLFLAIVQLSDRRLSLKIEARSKRLVWSCDTTTSREGKRIVCRLTSKMFVDRVLSLTVSHLRIGFFDGLDGRTSPTFHVHTSYFLVCLGKKVQLCVNGRDIFNSKSLWADLQRLYKKVILTRNTSWKCVLQTHIQWSGFHANRFRL